MQAPFSSELLADGRTQISFSLVMGDHFEASLSSGVGASGHELSRMRIDYIERIQVARVSITVLLTKL